MRRASGLIVMASAAAVLLSSAVAAHACDRAKSATASAVCDTKSCPASACAAHGVTAAKKPAVTRSASADLA